jgi:hypothetical protein
MNTLAQTKECRLCVVFNNLSGPLFPRRAARSGSCDRLFAGNPRNDESEFVAGFNGSGGVHRTLSARLRGFVPL